MRKWLVIRGGDNNPAHSLIDGFTAGEGVRRTLTMGESNGHRCAGKQSRRGFPILRPQIRETHFNNSQWCDRRWWPSLPGFGFGSLPLKSPARTAGLTVVAVAVPLTENTPRRPSPGVLCASPCRTTTVRQNGVRVNLTIQSYFFELRSCPFHVHSPKVTALTARSVYRTRAATDLTRRWHCRKNRILKDLTESTFNAARIYFRSSLLSNWWS